MHWLVRALKTLLLPAVFLLAACQEGITMTAYASDQIREISAQADGGGLTVLVDPMLESAFYLAGGTRKQADGRRQPTLVRCMVNRTCKVDIEGIYTPGTRDPVRLTLPDASMPVDVVFSDGSTREVFAP